MRCLSVKRVAVCMATLVAAAIGPVADASASSRSIKAAIVSYGPKIEAAETQVEVAGKEYEQSHDPAGVEAAIAASSSVLSALRARLRTSRQLRAE